MATTWSETAPPLCFCEAVCYGLHRDLKQSNHMILQPSKVDPVLGNSVVLTRPDHWLWLKEKNDPKARIPTILLQLHKPSLGPILKNLLVTLQASQRGTIDVAEIELLSARSWLFTTSRTWNQNWSQIQSNKKYLTMERFWGPPRLLLIWTTSSTSIRPENISNLSCEKCYSIKPSDMYSAIWEETRAGTQNLPSWRCKYVSSLTWTIAET